MRVSHLQHTSMQMHECLDDSLAQEWEGGWQGLIKRLSGEVDGSRQHIALIAL
jgi:hypothetical protein